MGSVGDTSCFKVGTQNKKHRLPHPVPSQPSLTDFITLYLLDLSENRHLPGPTRIIKKLKKKKNHVFQDTKEHPSVIGVVTVVALITCIVFQLF